MKWLKNFFVKNGDETKQPASTLKEPDPQPKTQTQVSPGEVKEKLDNNQPVILLDVRRDEEKAIAKIDGAKPIPMHEIHQRYHEISEDPNTEIIVFCHHGMRSEMVMHQLWGLGYQNTKNLAGGIDAWSLEIDPSIPRY